MLNEFVEQIVAKFRLKLKKAGKTTRPFRYDLNQIPYDYAVEVGMHSEQRGGERFGAQKGNERASGNRDPASGGKY